MTTLTIIEVLYIFLIIFITIIWTLLTLILIRLMRILGVVQEIIWYYDKIKKVLIAYSKIPETIKEVIKEKFWKK